LSKIGDIGVQVLRTRGALSPLAEVRESAMQPS
jgi:hypothetical protein